MEPEPKKIQTKHNADRKKIGWVGGEKEKLKVERGQSLRGGGTFDLFKAYNTLCMHAWIENKGIRKQNNEQKKWRSR